MERAILQPIVALILAHESHASSQLCLSKLNYACFRLIGIINMVFDKGVRWAEPTLKPIVALSRAQESHARVRILGVKAMALLSKEGDYVCRLLSGMGVVKALSVQLASAGFSKPIAEDVSAVRLVTQICEVSLPLFFDHDRAVSCISSCVVQTFSRELHKIFRVCVLSHAFVALAVSILLVCHQGPFMSNLCMTQMICGTFMLH